MECVDLQKGMLGSNYKGFLVIGTITYPMVYYYLIKYIYGDLIPDLNALNSTLVTVKDQILD